MTFSIIIPVYNAADYLPLTLESVFQQTDPDWEIILCDDGSTDDATAPLCDSYALQFPGKIRALHRPNGGPGAARNTGIEHAAGEYICFLDSDDRLAPNALEILSARIQNTNADLIELGFFLERNGEILKTVPPAAPSNDVTTLEETPSLMQSATSPWRRIYRRLFLNQTGVRFPEGVLVAEDMRMTLRLLALAKTITAVEDCLYYYVDRPGSIMRQGETERNTQVLDAVIDVTEWYRAQGLYDQYQDQLTLLAMEHVLLSTSVRVLRADPCNPLLEEIQNFMVQYFPNYADDKYVSQLPKAQKLALSLLRAKRYRTVKLLFDLKDHLT